MSTDTHASARLDWDDLRRRLQAATILFDVDDRNVDEAAILTERARRLAQAADAPVLAGESLDVVMFALLDEQYALEARYVREVLPAPAITPVPNTPRFLRGIYNLRGDVLAVMDVRFVLTSAAAADVDRWLIVIGNERAEFGIVADDVTDVTAISLESVMRVSANGLTNGSLIRGVTAEAVVLLDGDALLRDPRLTVDATATAISAHAISTSGTSKGPS